MEVFKPDIPFEKLFQFKEFEVKNGKESTNKISVLSYNILADIFTEEKFF